MPDSISLFLPIPASLCLSLPIPRSMRDPGLYVARNPDTRTAHMRGAPTRR